MLICVHRNRCRRRENGLGWLSLPGKSISEIGNPSSGCPTTANYGQPHGFIAREGRRVFVVTEYWQEIQRRELPRDPCTPTDLIKHRSAAQVPYNYWKQIFSSKMLPARSFLSLIRKVFRTSLMVSNSHLSTSKTYSQVMIIVIVHNTNWMSDINKRQTNVPNNCSGSSYVDDYQSHVWQCRCHLVSGKSVTLGKCQNFQLMFMTFLKLMTLEV